MWKDKRELVRNFVSRKWEWGIRSCFLLWNLWTDLTTRMYNLFKENDRREGRGKRRRRKRGKRQSLNRSLAIKGTFVAKELLVITASHPLRCCHLSLGWATWPDWRCCIIVTLQIWSELTDLLPKIFDVHYGKSPGQRLSYFS